MALSRFLARLDPSRCPWHFQPVETKEQLEKILNVARDKAAIARKTKRKKRVAKYPVKVVEEEWRAAYDSVMGHVPVAWGGKEGKLTKTILKEHGFDRTVDLYRHFLATWPDRIIDHRLEEGALPSVGYCFVIRDQLFAEMDGTKKAPGPVVGYKKRGETDVELIEDGPAEGWGDALAD